MKLISVSLITSLAASALAQMVNRTATNGWGSTPSQRHYINATQAMAVIAAGIEFSRYASLRV